MLGAPPALANTRFPVASSDVIGREPPEARATVLQSEENRPQTQKIRQNQMAKKYIPDEGTKPKNNN